MTNNITAIVIKTERLVSIDLNKLRNSFKKIPDYTKKYRQINCMTLSEVVRALNIVVFFRQALQNTI